MTRAGRVVVPRPSRMRKPKTCPFKFVQQGSSRYLHGLDNTKWYLVIGDEGAKGISYRVIGGPYDDQLAAIAALREAQAADEGTAK
jgi:hypothetical protein